jgi:hypothetical protein
MRAVVIGGGEPFFAAERTLGPENAQALACRHGWDSFHSPVCGT